VKDNIDYFSHYTNAPGNGKFILLQASYPDIEKGLAAEARFWRLNCLIGAAPKAMLDLSIPKNRAEAIKATMLNLVDFKAFIDLLASDEIQLIHKEGNVVWTEQTQEDLNRAMTPRIDSQKRRLCRVDQPFANEGEKLTNEAEKFANKNHGGEGIGGDRIGAEQAAVRAPVENPAQETQDLLAFALRLALKRKAAKPEAMARKLMTEPDVVEAFEAERRSAQARSMPPVPAPPDPPACDCGGAITTIHPGDRGRCGGCGAIWEFDNELGDWVKTQDGEIPIEGVG